MEHININHLKAMIRLSIHIKVFVMLCIVKQTVHSIKYNHFNWRMYVKMYKLLIELHIKKCVIMFTTTCNHRTIYCIDLRIAFRIHINGNMTLNTPTHLLYLNK